MTQTKVALITGSARRIGAGIARRLHAAGYDVALHAHTSQAELQALAQELESLRAGSTLTLQADLRDTAQLPDLVAQCVSRFGRLDALVNNASNFYPTQLHEATPAQWDDLFAVNARAPLFLAQAAAAQLRQHGGAIVNMTDVHAETPLRAHPLYSAAKAALAMLTRSLALELAPQVRVNAIAPGAILWPDAGKDAAAQQALLARTPLARTGQVEEIADTVRWLLDDASFVTGQTVRVDGGRGLT